MTRVIKTTVAMQKGGSGKSTLSRHGSVIMPRTALLDLDPQGTTLRWLERRQQNGDFVPSAIRTTFTRAKEALEIVDSAHAEIDHLIIDTPPEHDDQRTIRFAVQAADFVVLPCKPTPDDLEVLHETLKLVREYGKPYGIVLTMVRQNSRSLKSAKELVARMCAEFGNGELCPHTIGNRTDFVESVFFAKAVTEFAPTSVAAAEIKAVWDWIFERSVAAAKAKEGAIEHG